MFDIKSFYEAKDVADAINALVKNPDAEIISGGTDVLIRVREGKDAGRSVVSIHNIEALKGVRLLDDGDLWIGAGTAFSHITNDALIQKYIPMLGDAVDMVGGPQIRNTGTIGGNICNGATSADSASTMWTLEADVLLEGPEGKRRVPVCEFYTGPGRTATMLPGVRPIIRRASSPMAMILLVSRSMATTDGSFNTTPLPLIYTRMLAVPKSIPISLDIIENI